MPSFIAQIVTLVRTLFRRLPAEKRTGMIVSFLLIAGATVALLIWAIRPQYKVLYSDLSLEDSGQIVEVLQKEAIPFKLEQEGRRILVPSSVVYQTRLKLAASELPREHGSGWELFDRSNLGVTDFVQKLNYRRALEGELARTILQLDPVEAVRVHLVIPEESLFRENRKEPSASVTLRMKRGNRLAQAQVTGIGYLVSSSVEGMSPENVTVLDSRGNILSERVETNPLARLSSSQLELQQKVEASLVLKGQELLDKRFGSGRSAVQVTALLNFEQRELSRESYDADNPAVRSEEINSTTSMGSDTSSSNTQSQITNYELSLTRERTVGSVGDIRRLSIAVMVDGNYTTTGEGDEAVREFSPLPPKDLDEVRNTIVAALGYDETRGDEISVVSVPFRSGELFDDAHFTSVNRWDMVFQYGQKVVMFAAVIILLLMLRNFVRRAQATAAMLTAAPQIPGGLEPAMQIAGAGAIERQALPPLDSPTDEDTRQARRVQEQISTFVSEKPDVAARLVRSWLIED
ncbi:MAG: flagellar M-ring protein FliF [Calditrichaeota bacterium]|nr:flagellar M-ring protein FliF [Calditrichota bacterium]